MSVDRPLLTRRQFLRTTALIEVGGALNACLGNSTTSPTAPPEATPSTPPAEATAAVAPSPIARNTVAPVPVAASPDSTPVAPKLPEADPTSLDYSIIFSAQENRGDDEQHDLWLYELRSKRLSRLTNTPRDEMNPDIAPNGEMLYYVHKEKDPDHLIWRNRVDGKTANLNANDYGTQEYDPVWNPAATESNSPRDIIYAFKMERHTNGDQGDIMVKRRDGSRGNSTQTDEVRALLGNTEQYKPAFSNDGKWIYETTRLRQGDDSSDDIYKIPAEGDAPAIRLTNTPFATWYPSVNPTNDTLAYNSKDPNYVSDNPDNPYGPDRIWTMNPDGGQQTMLPGQPKDGDNSDAVWSPDGKWISFINNNDEVYRLWMIKADGSQSFEVPIDTNIIKGEILAPNFVKKALPAIAK
jgi:Tol biopolymer transport system component